MGAGTYVGRIGALAVALGIGAAMAAGAGVASAEDSDGASGGSVASSSRSAGSPSTSSGSSGPSSATTSPEGESGDPADSGDGDEKSDGTVNSDDDGDAETADEDLDDADVVDDLGDGEEGSDDDAGLVAEVEDTRDTGDGDLVVKERRARTEPADEPTEVTESEVDVEAEDEQPAAVEVDDPAVADEAQAPVEAEPVAAPPAVTEDPVAEPAPPAEEAPAETVRAALSVVDQQAAGQDPALPALASLVMSVVGAGRELTNETPQTVGQLVANSLVDSEAEDYPVPIDVVVQEWTPPLEFLQRIPVLGPSVVTPLVSLIHDIPLVSDVLHPFIGFPIDHWAPPGTPQPRSFLVRSFDNTPIFANFMPATGLQAGESAPTVLNGPGLGLPGSTTLELQYDSFLPQDVIGIGALRDAGYNVVTWDPRGEWRSGGVMHLNSPDLEGRDMSHIISYLATLPEVSLDAANDPRIGMTGASYGGGIQLAAAAIDDRIDAIVPTIAWNSLVDVLFPRDAVNSAWGTILPSVLALTLAREHPRIFPVAIQGVLFGVAQQSDIDLVNGLGYQDQIGDITAPTLLIQGTVDTLFTLDQAHTNAMELIEAGTTTKVVWYCGGHGACVSDYNDGAVVIDRTLDWLDRYVKGDESVDTGPQFEWVDQNGVWHSDEEYPATEGTPVVAERSDGWTIPFLPLLGGSGPNPLILTRGPIGTLLGLPSAAWALNAVNLHVPDAAERTYIVGAPELTLTYSGTGTAEHVYAQIVDDKTGLVLGNHATPIPVQLDGQTHTATFSLEQVAHTLEPGQSVTVQIVTSTAKFLNAYSWGTITVDGISVSLPTRVAVASSATAAA